MVLFSWARRARIRSSGKRITRKHTGHTDKAILVALCWMNTYEALFLLPYPSVGRGIGRYTRILDTGGRNPTQHGKEGGGRADTAVRNGSAPLLTPLPLNFFKSYAAGRGYIIRRVISCFSNSGRALRLRDDTDRNSPHSWRIGKGNFSLK